MASNRMRRIGKEIADIHADAHSQIKAEPFGNQDDVTHLRGSFPGPPGTPYEGGTYNIDIKIPTDYPFRPPTMKFETKVWHPNVSSQTVSTLPQYTLEHIWILMANVGCNLPRHAFHCLVASSDHQVRSAFAAIFAQHTRAQRSPRCRSG